MKTILIISASLAALACFVRAVVLLYQIAEERRKHWRNRFKV